MKLKLFYFSCLIIWCSCRDGKTEPGNKWEKEENTRGIDANDDNYRRAVHIAQATIDTFATLLNQHSINGWQYFVKMRFAQGGNVEHMWIEADTAYDKIIFGTIGNDPIKINNVKYGDKVQVPFEEVEDYSVYQRDSVLMGDFINKSLQK